MARELIPWREFARPLRRLEAELEDLTERFWGSEAIPFWERPEGLVPRTDVVETDQMLEVTVDLPGMKTEEFDVELKNVQLWISGETEEEKEEKGKTYHRVERQYGRFQRALSLPTAVDEAKIAAEYKEEVLRITLPKSETAKPKLIEVKAGA